MSRPTYQCPACESSHETGTLFYVSVLDGKRAGFLLGPYATHREALNQVDRGRTLAHGADPRAPFYAFGTAGSAEMLPTVFGGGEG